MLRLLKISRVAVASAALFVGTAAFAQGSGLGDRIADADKKLQSDAQACKPINLSEYVELLREAGQNRIRADKAKAKGVPVDETQVQADLANASALFNRAQAALVQQCTRAARAQPQPPTASVLPGSAPLTPAQAPAGQTCSGTPAIPASQPEDGPRIPSHEQIDKMAEDMEQAVKDMRTGDAEVIRGALDAEGARLRKMVKDAKAVGGFSNVNVREAEDRLKQVDDWIKWADKKGVRPCGPSEPPRQAQNSTSLDSFGNNMLNSHNALRAAFGVGPLRWSPMLADRSKTRSAQNAQAGELVHPPRDGRKERENISKAPASYTDQQIFNRWAQEDFVSGVFPNVCASGDWQTCAHKSQILSANVEEVGCGKTLGGIWWWIVCSYYPGGNRDGQFVGRRPDNYVEKVATNTNVRPRPVGGDYGGLDPARMAAEDVKIRWSDRDVFGGPMPPVATRGDSALNFMINGMLDFGDDDGISGFVGGGVGVARVDYNNVRAFSNQGAVLDDSDTNFAWQIIAGMRQRPASDPHWVEALERYFKTVGPYEPEPEVATNVVPPVLPPSEVFPQAARVPQVNSGTGQDMTVRTAPMFDLGIYAGGAWTTDWFHDREPLNHDYGFDGSLFVGYDLGAFRLEAEAAYKGAYLPPMNWMFDGMPGPLPPYVDTKVEPPQLPNKEVYKPEPSTEPLEPL
jgi:hypothetical protein